MLGNHNEKIAIDVARINALAKKKPIRKQKYRYGITVKQRVGLCSYSFLLTFLINYDIIIL